MKKNLFLIVLLFLVQNVFSQSFDKENLKIYGGLSIIPVNTKDFIDFHISDWENYGLGSVEGRVLVPLSSKKPKSSIGIVIGANYQLSEKFIGLFEINYALSGTSITQVLFGINYSVFQEDNFNICISPKIGYNSAKASFGSIQVLPGKTPPVILPEGTFNQGDELTMELSGVNAQVGLTGNYTITDKIEAFANLNFGLAFGSGGKLLASGVEIPMTANGVVKADWTSNQANINPKAKVQGLGLGIGIKYNLED